MNRFALKGSLILFALIFGNSIAIRSQDDPIYRLPAGTRIHLRMDAELSSRAASVDDTFIASVSRPVMRRNVLVLPVGTVLEGRVTKASPAGSGVQDGFLEVRFETIKLEGMSAGSIDGQLVGRRTESSSSLPGVLSVIGGTALGAVIGSLARPGSGALIGAGIGAGAGVGIALARKGKDRRLLKNEELEIELRKDVILPVRDY